MRQLLPSRPGDKMDRAWLLFSLLSGVLVWFAFSGIGLVKAQEPAKPDMPAAAKDAPAAKDEKAEAAPADGEAPAKSAAAPAAANGATPPSSREHAAVGDPGVRADRRVLCSCSRSISRPW